MAWHGTVGTLLIGVCQRIPSSGFKRDRRDGRLVSLVDRYISDAEKVNKVMFGIIGMISALICLLINRFTPNAASCYVLSCMRPRPCCGRQNFRKWMLLVRGAFCGGVVFLHSSFVARMAGWCMVGYHGSFKLPI